VRVVNVRLISLLLGVALLGGCRAKPSVALIDLEAGAPELRPIISAILDSLNRNAAVKIRLSTPSHAGGGAEPTMITEVYRALEAARTPEVVAAVGLAGSSDVMTAGPVYVNAGIPIVVPTANVPQLARLGSGIFLMAPTLAAEARFIGDFVSTQLGAASAMILYNPGAWGAALQGALAPALWQRGLRVLGPLPVPALRCGADEAMIARYVSAALRLGRPDVVVVASYELCLLDEFERQAPGLTFVVGDGLVVPTEYARGRPRLARRLYAVRFADSASQARDGPFAQRYERRLGTRPSWADAGIYDAVMMLVTAIRQVGPDREAVWRYLYQLGRSRPPYPGVTGSIAFYGERNARLSMRSYAPAAGSGR
jgi:ABC-type branched-subunit amino acid transport system substrate-binding protein